MYLIAAKIRKQQRVASKPLLLLNFVIQNPGFYLLRKIVYFCFMETTVTSPVTLTTGAIKEIRKLMSAKGFDTTQSLRVGVKGGGCSGMTYILGFDKKTENDYEFEIEGISCVMNKSHEIYLLGMEVDWLDGLNNRGFTFQNPNASRTCGCGTSFAV
jgi:iron-sulfur cluster assembly accessory protein